MIMGYSCKTLPLQKSVKITFPHHDIKHIWYSSHHNRQKDGNQMQLMSCLLNGFYTYHYLILTRKDTE